MQELADDLRNYLFGVPVEAQPVGPVHRAVELVRHHLLATAAVLAVIALILGFSAATYLQSLRFARERDHARSEQARAEQIARLPTIVSSHSVRTQVERELGNAEAALELYHEALDLQRQLLAPDNPGLADTVYNLARVKAELGGTLLSLRRYEEAEELLASSLPVLAEKLGAEHEVTERTRERLSRLYRETGQSDRAVSEIR